MATAGEISGNIIGISVGGNVIACGDTASLVFNAETIPINCKGSGDWAKNLTGGKNIELSGSGFMAFDASYGGIDLFDLLIAGTEATFKFGNEETGDIYYEFDGRLTNTTWDANYNEASTFSFTATGNGAPTKGTNA